MAQAAPSHLTLRDITNALEGNGIAFRRRTRLQPAGGPGENIPPMEVCGDETL